MVSIAVSKMGMTKLIFVDPGMKVNGQYYHDVLPSQQMLPAVKHVASNMYVFQQDNAPSHRAKHTIKLPQQEALSPPNSPDLSPVDDKVCGVMQQRAYECHMNSVDKLKQRLIDVWNSLQQNVIDTAINDWRKQLRACMWMDNILNICCEHV